MSCGCSNECAGALVYVATRFGPFFSPCWPNMMFAASDGESASIHATQQWRTYNKRVPGGLALLCSISGSGCPRALPFGIIAGVSCAMLELYADIDGFNLFEHTYPFHLIAFITGFGLIFRLNIAYQRYWEARPLTTQPSPHPHPTLTLTLTPTLTPTLTLTTDPNPDPNPDPDPNSDPNQARSLTQSMAAKWADAALQVIAFDEAAEGEAAASSPDFVAYAVHIFSLLHATALQSLRGDSVEGAFLPVPLQPLEPPQRNISSDGVAEPPLVVEALQRGSTGSAGGAGGAGCSCGGLLPHATVYPKLEVLGGLSEGEMRCLHGNPERCHLVYTWLLKEMVLRRKAGGLATDGPVVSRIYQVLSDGMLSYLGARKLADTPFPFPYAQLNAGRSLQKPTTAIPNPTSTPPNPNPNLTQASAWSSCAYSPLWWLPRSRASPWRPPSPSSASP